MDEDWDEFYRRTKEFVDKIFYQIMKQFEEILEELDDNPDNMKVYGFNIEVGPDGIPKIYRFGDVKHSEEMYPVTHGDEGEEMEPLIDVYDEGDTVKIIVELPGISEEDIDITPIDNKHILIETFKLGRRFRKVVELPTEVVANSVKTLYRNGVLEIVVKKKLLLKNTK
jgi:HSP20 family protein